MPKEKSPVITWDQDLFNYFFQIKTSIGDEADPAMVKSVLKTYEDFKPYIEK
jgi:hypothetical protein